MRNVWLTRSLHLIVRFSLSQFPTLIFRDVAAMRNHRNSVGMTMMNSTKQVNKVKPNVNRATNDSLSSPNQPYNQRYLIILRTVTFYRHSTHTHPNIIHLHHRHRIYSKNDTSAFVIIDDQSIQWHVCFAPNQQHMRISLLRIIDKRRRCVKNELPIETTFGFLFCFFFLFRICVTL